MLNFTPEPISTPRIWILSLTWMWRCKIRALFVEKTMPVCELSAIDCVTGLSWAQWLVFTGPCVPWYEHHQCLVEGLGHCRLYWQPGLFFFSCLCAKRQMRMGFPGGSAGKEFACNAGDLGLIPGLGRFPGEGNGNPLQYSCLENSMDWRAWWAAVHGVAEAGMIEWWTHWC